MHSPAPPSVPASATSERPIVFISYAREDRDFVLHLSEALGLKGAQVCGDWQLVRGEDYDAQLQDLQLSADAMIFVLSLASMESKPCQHEIERAVAYSKPILPVLFSELPDGREIPAALSRPQWTFLRPTDDFVHGVGELFEAINTDFDLMPEHRRLLQLANNWDLNGRSVGYLLRRDGLKKAEHWLSVTQKRPTRLPQPTPLQLDYLRASTEARTRGSRIALGATIAIAVALGVLAVMALLQRNEAFRQRNEADTQRNEANQQRQLATDREAEARRQEKLAIAAADEANRQRATAELNARKAEGIAAKALADSPGQEFEATVMALRSVVDGQAAPGEVFAGLAHAVTGLQYSLPLRGHTADVRDAAFSPDSKLAATASRDGTVKLWNVATGRLLRTLTIDPDWGVSAVRFSVNGTRLAAVSGSHARVYDTRTWKMLSVLKGHTGTIGSLDVSPDGRLVLTNSTADRSARLWDAETGATVRPFPWNMGRAFVPNSTIRGSAQFSRDGTRFLITKPNAAELWSVSGELMQSFEGSFGAADLSADGTKLITNGRQARVLETQSGKELHALNCQGTQAQWVGFSPDSRQAVTTVGDGSACLWDVAAGRLTAVLRGNAQEATNLAVNRSAKYSPDGSMLVTTGDDGAAQVWNTSDGRLRYRLHASAGLVMTASFSEDGRYLVTPMSDLTARIWTPRFGGASCELPIADSPLFTGLFMFPVAPYFVSTGEESTARVWDASACKPGAVFDPHGGRLVGAAISPDEQTVVTATWMGQIQTWSLKTHRPLRTLRPQSREPTLSALAMSPDGRTIATGSLDREVTLWPMSGGKPRTILSPERQTRIASVAFAPDGSRVAASHRNRAVIIDVQSGRSFALDGHEDVVTSVAFSPDGTRLATASLDHTARIWDTKQARTLATISGHAGPVRHVAFSRDGTRIVTASSDGTVGVWDVDARRLLVPLRAEANAAVFSQSGDQIITTGPDGTLRIYPISLKFFWKTACDLLAFQPEAQSIAAPCATWRSQPTSPRTSR